MARESTNLKLKLYNAVTDAKELAISWFNDIFDYSNSNWVKIDEAYKKIKDNSIKDISFSNNNISFTKGDDTSTTLSDNIITDEDFATQEKAGIVFPGVGMSVDDTGIISVVTDETLTKRNLPADAKVVGDELLKKSNSDHTHNLSTLINSLSTASSTPKDNDYFISQYVDGGTTTTSYYRRPLSALWAYIKGKADAAYLKLSGGTMTGSLHLRPSGSGSYNENIRMHPSSNNWSSIVMCGDDNTGDSGTSAKTWGISTFNGQFGIGKNGNGITSGSPTFNCTDGTWRANGSALITSANIGNQTVANATTATTATKLSTSAGSATQPVYFSGGKPVVCTYTLGKSVPSNAVFTDTTYTAATTSKAGLMSAADKNKLNNAAQLPYSIIYEHMYTGTGSTGSVSSPVKIQLSQSYDAIGVIIQAPSQLLSDVRRILTSTVFENNYLHLDVLSTTFKDQNSISGFYMYTEGSATYSSSIYMRYANNLLEMYSTSSSTIHRIWNRANYKYYVFGIKFNM